MILSDRKFFVLIVILFIIVAFPLYYLGRKEFNEEQLLRAYGIHTEATVLNVRWTKLSKRSYRYYYMDITFFTATETFKIVEPFSVSLKHPVDTILEKMKLNLEPNGNYVTITIPILGVTAKRYNANDKVSIVYLKDKLDVIRLEEEL